MVLIGLGNPGKKYVSTRHNAGKMLAAWLKEEGRRKKEEGKWKIMETDCFMNQSGEWIYKFYKNYKGYKSYQNLFVAHDDLDMPLGSFKIHFGRGPRLHKGILSIEQALGTKEFWRVRIGIDNRKSQLSSAKISKHQIADKSAESDSGLSDLIHNPILADASRSKPTFSVSGEEYVLRPFKREEKAILYRAFGSIAQIMTEQFTKSFRSDVDSKLIN